jgi:hypothetical protein
MTLIFGAETYIYNGMDCNFSVQWVEIQEEKARSSERN